MPIAIGQLYEDNQRYNDGHFSNFDKTLTKLYFRKLLYSRNLFHKLLWLKSLVIETKLMLS